MLKAALTFLCVPVPPALLPSLFLVSLGWLVGACAPEPASQAATTPQAPAPNAVRMVLDGATWASAENRVRNDSMTFNPKELYLTLVTTVERQEPGSGGVAWEPTPMSLVIHKNDLKTGTYELLANSISLASREDDVAWMKVVGSDAIPALESSRGTVTFERLETTNEGFTHYGVLEVVGHWKGTFRGPDGEHTVSGSFEYTRP